MRYAKIDKEKYGVDLEIGSYELGEQLTNFDCTLHLPHLSNMECSTPTVRARLELTLPCLPQGSTCRAPWVD